MADLDKNTTFEDDFSAFAGKSEAPLEDDDNGTDATGLETESKTNNAGDSDPGTNDSGGPAPDSAGRDSDAGDDGKSDAVIRKEEYERLKRENAELRHRAQSDGGRVSALQRKLNTLDHEMAELRKRKEVPTEKQVTEALADEAKWKKLEEEYGDFITVFKEQFATLDARVEERIAQKVKPLEEKVSAQGQKLNKQESDEFFASQSSLLAAPPEEGGFGYPDWEDITGTPEFAAWVAEKDKSGTSGVQSLIHSPHASEFSIALGLFEKETGFKRNTKQNNTPPKTEGSNRRQEKLAAHQALPRSTGVSAASADPETFDGSFAAFARKKEKEGR